MYPVVLQSGRWFLKCRGQSVGNSVEVHFLFRDYYLHVYSTTKKINKSLSWNFVESITIIVSLSVTISFLLFIIELKILIKASNNLYIGNYIWLKIF